MINALPGYQIIEVIHSGVRTVIYLAVGEDGKKAIVKTLKAEYPTLEEITRLRHEYKILQPLDIEGIIQTYGIEKYKNGLALILDYFEGECLKNLMTSQKIPVPSFLSIAIQLVSILAELHQNNIIHKDIKPQNILINPKTQSTKIIDFSISTRLSRENPSISNPDLLEGTLAYMSPEQTGRMNRSLDYRTDLYSLGVTFYEILTGQLPFNSTDPMELVYCHIAKKPVSPHQLNPEIPEAVSDIVMKLLAKTAEDRYQSALGLKADLETCFAQLQASGKIVNFIPGKLDKCGQFLIPQKLYGREVEVAQLLEAFERVADNSQSQIELMLVSGYSGIGKTSVVNEIHKPIVRQRGYFIGGKFDQFKRNIPYAALIQALQELMRQLLTENPEKIAVWKEKLLEAFGQNGQVIIDVIPEVELIVGKQPAVPTIGPTESQNRFNRLFQKFIQVFTQKEHPLVLFLDDLQWADSASLKLIQLLMTDADSKYLLMIGAYRDNEVSPIHPSIQTIEKIKQSGAVVNNIILQPLDLFHVNQLVADTLSEADTLSNQESIECLSETHRLSRQFLLADLLFNKTQGNPFFLNQMFKTLYQEKLLTFDFIEGRWLWDIEQIQAIGITDYSVVELVARNIKKLSKSTQEILKLAACIGNQFNLDVLAIVNKKSLLDTANDLWEALQSGLILPLSQAYKIPLVGDWGLGTFDGRIGNSKYPISYKFLHDRVQQAGYFLIPEDQKKSTHLKIGQLLLRNTLRGEREEKIFDIVNQLNLGWELISDLNEQNELAQLNFIAGRKAKMSTAYAAAVRYFSVAMELQPPDNWQSHYDLTLALHIEAAEAEYLNINFERSLIMAEIAMQNAANLLDRVKVYELQMQLCIAQLEMVKAVDIGLQVLSTLGISLLEIDVEKNLIVDLPNLADLENIPTMTDPYKLSAMQILKILCAPVFMAKPEIFPQLIITMVNLCIEYGNSAISSFAYGFYGLLLVGFGKLDAGYQAGIIALKVLDKFDAKELKAKVYNLFNSNIRSWKEHNKNSVVPLQEGVQSGLEIGDIEWGGYCAANLCSYLFFTEDNLESAVQQQAVYVDLCIKINQEIPTHFSQVWRQLGLNLEGASVDRALLIGASFDEAEMLPRLIEAKSGTVLFIFYVAKTILLYLFGDFDRSLKNVAFANEQAGAAFGFMQVVILNFYYSLALLGHYPQANRSDQQKYLEQVEANQEKMKLWADSAPMNNQHKYELVEAEKAQVLGKNWQAADLYDRAISLAKENEYINEEALAHELAAKFYLRWGKPKIARIYMIDAYYAYTRWGAKAKVKYLEERYPEFFFQLLKRETTDIDFTLTTTTSTTGGNSALLDLVTVMKASQAISSEIVLDKLLENLMEILMQNAGARKVFLLLRSQGGRGDKLVLIAEGNIQEDEFIVQSSVTVKTPLDLPVAIINYIEKTHETLVLNNPASEGIFTNDPYIASIQPKSILGLPLIYQGKFNGILYLENNLTVGAFTQQRCSVLKLLAAQASISLENASIYNNLQESEAREREKALQLEQSLHKLQQTQAQLVQTEKISSLGQLVAGVAHEVNNPVSFISGNLHHASEYVQDLLNLVNLYGEEYPHPTQKIEDEIEAIELEYLIEDLPKLLSSMKVGTDRIRDIMQSLRNFSRVDTQKKPADIHAGLESTLMILQHRLKAKAECPAIAIVKEYGDLPLVECYAGPLNQVFMNLLANAIDAIEESQVQRNRGVEDKSPIQNLKSEIQNPQIRIRTEFVDGDKVVIGIKDNGPGMAESVRSKLFDPFFTTKPEGKGTGLGLSIGYQIVVEKHQGSLKCISAPGEGTEFVIEIPVGREDGCK